jgi:hypothetical protein
VRSLVGHPGVSSILLESIAYFETFSQKFGQPIDVHRVGYLLISDASQNEQITGSLAASVRSRHLRPCAAPSRGNGVLPARTGSAITPGAHSFGFTELPLPET